MSNPGSPAQPARPLPRVILCLALGGVLAYAGLSKLGDPHAFARQIAQYRLLPAQASQALAVTLPWLELVCGLALALGLWVRPAALVSAALMAVFAAAVVSALARGLDISCGCFGTESAARAGLPTLVLEAGCFGAAAAIVRLAGKEKAPALSS
ncbi:MAG: DoxX family membrane protein [Planctomycetota bacterium]|nr:DoxX family membrane protein [Planctomycetota bacterium]